MKDLKTIIAEARTGNTSNTGNTTFSLNVSDLDKIMYSLAFTATWGDADVNAYKKLWDELAEGTKKTFGDDSTAPEDWTDYELSHRGSARRLN